MSLFETIYVDIKKTGSKAANTIIFVLFCFVLVMLLLNAYVYFNCPKIYAYIFATFEAVAFGLLFSKCFRGAGIFGFIALVMLCIAIAKIDSPWTSERQPLKHLVVKLGKNPEITLYNPRILARKIKHWNQVFELGMKKPDDKKNVIVLGGFEIISPIGKWGFKTKTANINLLDVKRIQHETGVANRKIVFCNGTVITGQCLRFTNFMALNPGDVWIEGKPKDSKKLKINFDKFSHRGDYIEFYWQ